MANWRNIIPFIRKAEGGLSKHSKDSAAKNPVPDGSGYHTNKGITWGTFTGLAARLGYTPTPALFYQMPDWVWEKIWKSGFWDAVKGDRITSQGVADILADFAWGAGPGRAIRVVQKVVGVPVDGRLGPQTLAAINRRGSGLIEPLAAAKKAFYLSLQSAATFGAGWSKRLDELEAIAKKELPAVAA